MTGGKDDILNTEAFEPWLPTYADIIHRFPDHGFPGLEIDAEQFPIISSRRAEIEMRFYERYASRMVNQETLSRWQLRLQNRFDEVAPEFERAFRLYDKYKNEIENDMIEGYKMESSHSSENSGTDNVKNNVKNRRIDTPDTALNHDDNYADSLEETDGDNTTTYGMKNTTGSNAEYKRTGALILQNINRSIYDYRDIDTEFVRAFENNFLNIFWS